MRFQVFGVSFLAMSSVAVAGGILSLGSAHAFPPIDFAHDKIMLLQDGDSGSVALQFSPINGFPNQWYVVIAGEDGSVAPDAQRSQVYMGCRPQNLRGQSNFCKGVLYLNFFSQSTFNRTEANLAMTVDLNQGPRGGFTSHFTRRDTQYGDAQDAGVQRGSYAISAR